MSDLIKHFIGGRWVEAQDGESFPTYNPATEELIARAALGGPADIAAAVEAAKAAYPEWRLMPAPRRGEILYQVARILEARKEQLAQLLTREMGKYFAEAR